MDGRWGFGSSTRLCSFHPTDRGFTLVEILVAIGIIGVLVGLLFPAIMRSRSSAMQVQCAMRMRTLSQACSVSAGDSGGHLPLAGLVTIPDRPGPIDVSTTLGQAVSNRNRFVIVDSGSRLLAPLPVQIASGLGVTAIPKSESLRDVNEFLLKQEKLRESFYCPTAAREQFPSSVMVAVRHGSINEEVIWHTQCDYGFNGYVFGANLTTPDSPYLGGKVIKVRKGSQTLLFTEIESGSGSRPERFWAGESSRVTLSLGPAQSDGKTYRPTLDFARHRGRLNVLYVDGHVDSLAEGSGRITSILLK